MIKGCGKVVKIVIVNDDGNVIVSIGCVEFVDWY